MTHALDVGRMRSTYLMPSDQPSPERLAARLDEIAGRELPRALGSILSAICPADDPSVWLIPRLDVSLDVNGDWDADQLARAWAIELARALARALRAPDGRTAIRFANRAEYVAAFLGELAEGSAWGCGRYEAFAGLRMLAASAAIRTVLIDATEPGARALAALNDTTLKRVLTALSSGDAAIVVRQFLSRAGHVPSRASLARAIEAWQVTRGVLTGVSGAHRRAIWWIARLSAGVGETAHADDAVTAAGAIVALDAAVQASASAEERATLVARVAHGDGAIAGLPSFVSDRHLRAWRSHHDLLQAAVAGTGTAERDDAAARVDAAATAFGAAFWLLPLLDALPAEAWTARPQRFRFDTFVGCCPPELRIDAVKDGYLRDLFGVSPQETDDDGGDVPPACVEEWMRDQEHAALGEPFDDDYFGLRTGASVAAHAIVRLFAWKLAGFGRASARHLWMNCLNVNARVEHHADRVLVTVSRPPLDVVLRLAGLVNTSYTAPHFDRRPFVIASGD